jgi:hypothetical protein
MNQYKEYTVQMTDHELVEAVDRLCLALSEKGVTAQYVEIGRDLVDPRSQSYKYLYDHTSPRGYQTVQFNCCVGMVEISFVPGRGIRATDEARIPGTAYQAPNIKPVWGAEQLWIDDEGTRVIVRMATNSSATAVRAETGDSMDWSITASYDLMALGFAPAFGGQRISSYADDHAQAVLNYRKADTVSWELFGETLKKTQVKR